MPFYVCQRSIYSYAIKEMHYSDFNFNEKGKFVLVSTSFRFSQHSSCQLAKRFQLVFKKFRKLSNNFIRADIDRIMSKARTFKTFLDI